MVWRMWYGYLARGFGSMCCGMPWFGMRCGLVWCYGGRGPEWWGQSTGFYSRVFQKNRDYLSRPNQPMVGVGPVVSNTWMDSTVILSRRSVETLARKVRLAPKLLLVPGFPITSISTCFIGTEEKITNGDF